MKYTTVWRSPFSFTQVRGIGHLARSLVDAARDLRQMKAEGVTLYPEGGIGDDYAVLMTTDPHVARKYGFDVEAVTSSADDVVARCPDCGEPVTFCCPVCGVQPGREHRPGCSMEQCPGCGGQAKNCDCPSEGRLPWTGEVPCVTECQEYGWYARLVPGAGWVPCGEDEPGATCDLNRLFREAQWCPRERRFLKKVAATT
jgi:hypothetical protein